MNGHRKEFHPLTRNEYLAWEFSIEEPEEKEPEEAIAKEFLRLEGIKVKEPVE